MRTWTLPIKEKHKMDDERSWRIDPTKLPKKLDLDLSADAAEQLRLIAQQTGRSEDELILKILNQSLKTLQSTQDCGQNKPDNGEPE